MASYYDVDDILAEEELVPSVFQHAANGVGIFDSSDLTNKVEAASRVELPFWLACELYLRRLISIRVPPSFNKESKTREEIGADAANVDLRSRCPYFYTLGCKIAPLFGDKTIGPFLLVAFRTRYKEVLIKAHTLTLAAAPKYMTLLTNEEAKSGSKDGARFKNLENRGCAIGYGLGSGNPLSPSFNFGLELAKNSQGQLPMLLLYWILKAVGD